MSDSWVFYFHLARFTCLYVFPFFASLRSTPEQSMPVDPIAHNRI